MRYLREPKEYTGLPDSQVRIKVDPDGYENNHLTGIQKYINCSDGKNIVKGKQKFGMSIDAIFGIIFGSMLACCSLSIGLTAAYINFKNKYSKL
ncbi:MAG: hypothetical protein S4CHLAM7_02730 [Chlamydiae bacterium]|nr:hypothetical protein [Chlamydiota bacterium]